MAHLTREELLKDPKMNEQPNEMMDSLLNRAFIQGTQREGGISTNQSSDEKK